MLLSSAVLLGFVFGMARLRYGEGQMECPSTKTTGLIPQSHGQGWLWGRGIPAIPVALGFIPCAIVALSDSQGVGATTQHIP